jgi:hypothetical protein
MDGRDRSVTKKEFNIKYCSADDFTYGFKLVNHKYYSQKDPNKKLTLEDIKGITQKQLQMGEPSDNSETMKCSYQLELHYGLATSFKMESIDQAVIFVEKFLEIKRQVNDIKPVIVKKYEDKIIYAEKVSVSNREAINQIYVVNEVFHLTQINNAQENYIEHISYWDLFYKNGSEIEEFKALHIELRDLFHLPYIKKESNEVRKMKENWKMKEIIIDNKFKFELLLMSENARIKVCKELEKRNINDVLTNVMFLYNPSPRDLIYDNIPVNKKECNVLSDLLTELYEMMKMAFFMSTEYHFEKVWDNVAVSWSKLFKKLGDYDITKRSNRSKKAIEKRRSS